MELQLALVLEEEACDYGKWQAAIRNSDWLALFREAAEEVYRTSGTADIERVREYVRWRGIVVSPGNWMGSVFRGWTFTGRTVKARHEGGHARDVKVWTR